VRGAARRHPTEGWLFLEARDYRQALDRLLLERDRLNDPQHVGPAPGFLAWVEAEQLPELLARDYYKRQAEARLQGLGRELASVEAAISEGRHDRKPEAVELARQIARLEALLHG